MQHIFSYKIENICKMLAWYFISCEKAHWEDTHNLHWILTHDHVGKTLALQVKTKIYYRNKNRWQAHCFVATKHFLATNHIGAFCHFRTPNSPQSAWNNCLIFSLVKCRKIKKQYIKRYNLQTYLAKEQCSR